MIMTDIELGSFTHLPWVLQELPHLDMGNLRRVIAGAPAGPPPPRLEPTERKVWGSVLFELKRQA